MRSLRRSIKKSSRARDGRFRKSLSRAVGIGLLGVSGSAMAQSQTEEVPLAPVDVRAQRRANTGSWSPASSSCPTCSRTRRSRSTIVPQELMREQAVFNLRDALRNVTGISLAAGEGGGAQGDNLTLRGFSARNDIFLDGIRDCGSVHPRRLQPRVGRGPQGAVVDRVRPRLHRRRHQPGEQGAERSRPLRLHRHRRHRAVRRAPPSTSTSRWPTPRPSGSTRMFQRRRVVGRDEVAPPALGRGAVVHLRARRTPTRLTPATTTSTRTTRPTTGFPSSSASRRRCRPEQLLRADRARLREDEVQHRHPRGSTTSSTTTSAAQHPALRLTYAARSGGRWRRGSPAPRPPGTPLVRPSA